MTPLEFEQRLNACWDARRDPADDAELCAWLCEHPEALEDFAARRAAMLALATRVPAGGRAAAPSSRRVLPRAMAALAAAAVLVWSASLWHGGISCHASPPAPVGRVLSATLEQSPVSGQQTATWCERQVLCATPDARLEIVHQRSARR